MNTIRQIQTRALFRASGLVSNSATRSSSLKFLPQTRTVDVSSSRMPIVSLTRSMCSSPNAQEELNKRIEGCINSGDVVVFMKGVPEAPRCGFSNAVCQILRMHDVNFKSYDVLSDEELRSGVKEFSKWPTYPQVFFKGELIGGCDILLQMHQSGDLIEELEKIGIKSALLQPEEPGQPKE